MMYRILFLLLLSPIGWCGPAEERIELLLREQWNSPDVKIEWEFRGAAPTRFDPSRDWKLAKESFSRLSGNMVICIVANDRSEPSRLCMSGTARVFGPAWTPRKTILAGQEIKSELLDSFTVEYTHLRSPILSVADLDGELCATRTLVPGRPLTQADVKPRFVVRRDSEVEVHCHRGSVVITTFGRALRDGRPGEEIPIMLKAGKEKRVKGRVTKTGQVLLEP